MKIVVFGLAISSAWGNGHATLLRGLLRALHALGHEVHFFERDVACCVAHRDSEWFPFVQLHLHTLRIDAIADHREASMDRLGP
jgi:spore maturation protein CgeB